MPEEEAEARKEPEAEPGQAEPAEAPEEGAGPPAQAEAKPAQFPTFDEEAKPVEAANLDMLMDVELGRTRMLVEDILKLAEGSVIELEKLAGDPVDILVNDQTVAKGEVLVADDNFCIRITEILSPKERLMRAER
jgi:flagellar motor switch protein FliN/FliY